MDETVKTDTPIYRPMLERVRKCIENSPVKIINGYSYIINPLMDGVSSIDPSTLMEVAEEMCRIGDFDCDVILAPEAMGIPFATLVSQRTGVPMSIIRKKRYDLPGEVEIAVSTGYSTSRQYINGISAGDRVVIVDDVVSTGGTLRALLDALRDMKVEVVDVVIALDKSEDLRAVEEAVGQRIKTVIRVEWKDGRPVAVEPIR